MLRIIQNTSAGGAKSYYTTSDYYSEGQELAGNWRGKGAELLGLSGKVEKEAWSALCDNRHPVTGKTLTLRRKQERRVGYDFNFHVPKSVSLLYGVTEDARILEAFRASVDATMRDIESEAKTRVRKDGKNEDRVAGNLVWGEFIHTTARPIDGIPDPHLHAHCFVFNVTFDEKEGHWKAAQFGDVKQDAAYFQAKFHSRLTRHLAELGLPVERTRKGWEIAGFSKSSLDKFSRRTARIEEEAKASGTTSAKEKDGLGAKTRERKQKHLSMEQLRCEWLTRLSSDESDALLHTSGLVGSAPIAEREGIAQEAAINAIEHLFERKSVVPERVVLAEAMKRSFGDASVERIKQAVADRNLIVGQHEGRRVATTPDVLAEEKSMIDWARRGRGQGAALVDGHHIFKREWLNSDQRQVVQHVLHSRDRVMVIRGAAGTGKTSMMKEAAEAIEAAGMKVFAFAPSADASRGVLRSEGFNDADTIALLLKDEKLQQRIAGQVMWIDEASLIGTRTMAQVFALADKLNARVILQGDRFQHGSVERGAALRLLETDAGLIPAELKKIQRQRGDYREAVRALSDGRSKDGFEQLDRLGWIVEVNEIDRYKLLAKEYGEAVTKGKSALVVSPTHREAEHIDDAIRSELRQAGMLKADQRRFTVLENAHLTVAERRDRVNLLDGDVLVFDQNAKGHRKGDSIMVGDGPVPVALADRFTAYHATSLSLSPGDLIRVTRNGKSVDGMRLNNGAIFQVKDFTKDGNIRLTNGGTIAKDWGHWTYGYTVTSHGSQGRTVDCVFVGQSSESFPASSRQQFYVTCSRGRQQVKIFTDDKKALLEAVERTDEQVTATDLLADQRHYQRVAAIERSKRSREVSLQKTAERQPEIFYER